MRSVSATSRTRGSVGPHEREADGGTEEARARGSSTSRVS